ncbi:unnamed protein product, partial [Cuscuta campestris]
WNGLTAFPMERLGPLRNLPKYGCEKYQDNYMKRKKFTYLNTVGQREKESLTQFLTRWRDEVDKVEEMDDKTAMSLLMNAFRSGDLYTEFCRRPPSSYQEAYNTAWEYAEAEVLNKSKQELEEGYTKVKAEKPKKDDQTGGSKPRATYDGGVHRALDRVMAMMQQAGGLMPSAYPGMTPPIMPPPVSTPSTFAPRMVPIRPVNLTGTMNEAAPSNVHEVDEAEQEEARRRKGKAIAKPSKTRDSAFKRLGDKEDGPRKSPKLRLGSEMGRTSAMERLGGNRPAQSRRSRESETIHLDEEEVESQPRASAYTRLSYDEDDLDKIGSVARKLCALEEKVEEKAGAKKHTLAKSPFSARVHAQKLRRK